MMSGGFIPYHLRHNKSIDREIFIDSLSILSHTLPIKNYTYIGFGGPMLEDFRLIHSRAMIARLISLEETQQIHTRQLYNLPFNCIECKLQITHDFILDYEFEEPSLVWLDYASPRSLKNDLDDIRLFCTKISENDILKVTFPINPSSYYQRRVGDDLDFYKDRFKQSLKSKLTRDYLNFDMELTNADMSDANLTNKTLEIICNAYKSALERGLTDRMDDLSFELLNITKYNDGNHTMLTLTGIFTYFKNREEFVSHFKMDDWAYISNTWSEVHEIAIPTLTIKEKLNLDSKLPDRESYLEVANQFALSERERENYYKYYRLYPSFQRVIV